MPSFTEPEMPMILKLGMKHLGMEVYNIYINHDPVMTFLRQRQLRLSMYLNGNFLKCHLMGKTCSKLANGLNFYDLKKRLIPGFILPLPRVYIHAYYHSRTISL